jgi:hypothetical protein
MDAMARIPVGFIGHGAPTLALEEGGFAAALGAWGAALREAAAPRGVAIVSAHWTSAIARTGVEARAPLFYDFGGFDPALRDVQYPAPRGHAGPGTSHRLGAAPPRRQPSCRSHVWGAAIGSGSKPVGHANGTPSRSAQPPNATPLE